MHGRRFGLLWREWSIAVKYVNPYSRKHMHEWQGLAANQLPRTETRTKFCCMRNNLSRSHMQQIYSDATCCSSAQCIQCLAEKEYRQLWRHPTGRCSFRRRLVRMKTSEAHSVDDRYENTLLSSFMKPMSIVRWRLYAVANIVGLPCCAEQLLLVVTYLVFQNNASPYAT